MTNYRLIMTGGGSAGHVTPNLALMPELKKRGFDIQYIGSFDGIERKIITENNIKYNSIASGKLRRYFDVKNFTDPFNVLKGIVQAFKIMKKEKPDVIFSKGGFVTVPVVIASYLNRIPVVCHESDFTPGLANKLALPWCSKICVTFPETADHVNKSKAVITGTPIRRELFEGSRIKGKAFCGFTDDKPVLLFIGGSLGSKVINDSLRKGLEPILKKYNVIHICGKGNIDVNYKINSYIQFEYVSDELPHLFACADLVVSRAGANAIFELLALKKPNILIPLSRKSSRGDQILNANSFKKSGYSEVIEEEQLNEKILIETIDRVFKQRTDYTGKMEQSNLQDAIRKIVDVIEEQGKKHKK